MFGRLTLIAFVALFALAAPVSGQAPGAARPADEDVSRTNRTVFPASLAGRWTSTPFELALTSDFHKSVYGAGARSVRSVTMAIQPSGEGVFTVTSSVRDRARARRARHRGDRGSAVRRRRSGRRSPGRQPHYATRIVKPSGVLPTIPRRRSRATASRSRSTCRRASRARWKCDSIRRRAPVRRETAARATGGRSSCRGETRAGRHGPPSHAVRGLSDRAGARRAAARSCGPGGEHRPRQQRRADQRAARSTTPCPARR